MQKSRRHVAMFRTAKNLSTKPVGCISTPCSTFLSAKKQADTSTDNGMRHSKISTTRAVYKCLHARP
jgi:hypothetical protein